MSDLSRDEGVSRYLDAAGRDRVTAYGFLTLLLEAIASRMDSTQGHLVCTATYSIPQWGRITYSHPNRVRKYLRLCEVIEWVQVEFEGSSCTVSIPKMVEWRDETTRKSGVLPEQVAQKREEKKRKEEREKGQKDTLSDGYPKESQRRRSPPDFEITKDLQEWAATNYPSVPIDTETAKFRRHEFPTPRNDWDAAWKTWIQRTAEYQGTNDAGTGSSSETEELLNLGALMNVEKRPAESTLQYCSRVQEINQRRLDTLDS